MISVIRDNLYSNTYIIDRFNACYIVDPSDDFEGLMEHVKEKEVLGILITHAHFDHLSLIGKFNVPVFISKEDAYMLFEDDYNGYNSYNMKRPFTRKDLDLRFVGSDTKIPLCDQYITVIKSPGHTAGSVCYLYQDKLFSGDTIFKDGIGRTDFHSGSTRYMKKTVFSLLDSLNPNTKIYPGHGEKTTVRDEKRNNPYYKKT